MKSDNKDKSIQIISPCINCITYPICKSEYVDACNRRENSTDSIISVWMYRRILARKCSLIKEYIQTKFNGTYSSETESIYKLLYNTFINPNF